MSHPWGTAAISGIIHGIVGVKQTAVAWATFTVKPLLASLKFVNATVPTIRGPIVVEATPSRLSVSVPCNTFATLCVQQHQRSPNEVAGKGASLVLDGVAIDAARMEQHLCATQPIGCAASPRVLEVAAERVL